MSRYLNSWSVRLLLKVIPILKIRSFKLLIVIIVPLIKQIYEYCDNFKNKTAGVPKLSNSCDLIWLRLI